MLQFSGGNVYPRIIALALASCVILTSCEDEPTESPCPDGSTGQWNQLDVHPEWVTALELTNSELVVSGGVSGVFVQSPPICGEFEFAGSAFPELALGILSYGAYRLAVVDDSLYRGFRGPINHIPVECGGLAPPFGSTPCSDGITPRQLNDMMGLPSGELLLCTSSSVYLKSRHSASWQVTLTGLFFDATFSRGAAAKLYLATRGPGINLLHRSLDSGRSWQRLTPIWPAGAGPGDIRSLATTSTGDTVLAATATSVLLSTDGGTSFSALRPVGAPAVVRIEPQAPSRCLVLADSLFESRDLGITWAARSLPGRLLLPARGEMTSLPMDVSWESNRLVIGRLGNDNAEVWWCELD